MAAERGGPGYAKIKAEFLKINHSNGNDNNNDNYFKNAKMLSDEITTKWKNKEPVPVEYLATRALRKLSVIFVKEVPPKETKTEETSADNMAQTKAKAITNTLIIIIIIITIIIIMTYFIIIITITTIIMTILINIST